MFLVPEFGIVVVEVKGHARVNRDPFSGQWHLGEDSPRVRSPFRQASDAMFSLRDYLTRHNPTYRHIQYESLVVFPFAEFYTDGGSIEWHPWQVVDRHDLSVRSLPECVLTALDNARRDAVERRGQDSPMPLSEAMCRDILQLLCPTVGSYLPEVWTPPSFLMQGRRALSRHLDELDLLLDAVWLNDRLLIRGGPGTGKTGLLIKAAQRVVTEGHGPPLLVCFNRLLAQDLSRQLRNVAKVTTYHELLSTLQTHHGSQQLAVAHTARIFRPVRTLLIDEAEDFLLQAEARAALDLCVEGGLAEGRVIATLDDRYQQLRIGEATFTAQDIFAGYLSLDLQDNRRTLPRVSSLAELYSGHSPWRRTVREDDLVQPLTSYGSPEQVVGMLADVQQQFQHEGFTSAEMVVLSGCRPDQSLAARAQQQGFPFAPYGQQSAHEVPYTSVQAFKGRECPVVILTNLPYGPDPNTLMLIGLTRSIARVAVLVEKQSAFIEQYLRRIA
ncbi:nuclease-related domain-containing DEAD/DEAH box helicase [Deinococcus psychrotolerans]|uniref:nuclease-related domain-containing DEAD/DEAH box helicase n=1 Tax=Deinococcus psychrotolerans TaxID=2489213 RepID=UPI001F1497E7|nr:NERD domain-containing protein/DEAD/DEAH box helicase [Deinococcus psychrotolerans]